MNFAWIKIAYTQILAGHHQPLIQPAIRIHVHRPATTGPVGIFFELYKSELHIGHLHKTDRSLVSHHKLSCVQDNGQVVMQGIPLFVGVVLVTKLLILPIYSPPIYSLP